MFTIVRHQKHKMSSLSAAYNHNTRQLKSEFDHGNIDHGRSSKNIAFDFYHGQTLQEKLAHRIEQLDGAPPRVINKNSKNDTVVAIEILITASPEFFQTGNLNQWANTNINALRERFGENLLHAALHLDEETPHIHAFYTPLCQKPSNTGEPVWKFDAKNLLNRKALIETQDFFANKNAPLGLKRGVSAAKRRENGAPAHHVSLKKYRAELSANVGELKQEISEFKAQKVEVALATLGEVEQYQKLAEERTALLNERNELEQQCQTIRHSMKNLEAIIQEQMEPFQKELEQREKEIARRERQLEYDYKQVFQLEQDLSGTERAQYKKALNDLSMATDKIERLEGRLQTAEQKLAMYEPRSRPSADFGFRR